jgi:hypothetical protein
LASFGEVASAAVGSFSNTERKGAKQRRRKEERGTALGSFCIFVFSAPLPLCAFAFRIVRSSRAYHVPPIHLSALRANRHLGAARVDSELEMRKEFQI